MQVLDVLLPVKLMTAGVLKLLNGRRGRYSEASNHVPADQVASPVHAMRTVHPNQLAIICRFLGERIDGSGELFYDIAIRQHLAGAPDLDMPDTAADHYLRVVVTVSARQIDDKA